MSATVPVFPVSAVAAALEQAGLLVARRGAFPEQARGIADDSRQVQPGGLFVAVRGAVRDGHDFLPVAEERGAAVVVVEDPTRTTLPALVVREGRRAAAVAAAAAYGEPARELRLVAVTGTNGKTTTVGILRHLLDEAPERAASIGTLGVLLGSEGAPMPGGQGLTTPGPVELQRVLRALVDGGARTVAMEVSSHSLDQHRVDGLAFDAAVFTNVTRDHLDYHGTMDAYFAAKARLVCYLTPNGAAVVNADDAVWDALPPAPRAVRYSAAGRDAQVYARRVAPTPRGSEWTLHVAQERGERVRLPLIGDFNVANALGAAAAAHALGVGTRTIAGRLATVPQVPGRLEILHEHPTVLRDYAHTPDALARALDAVRPFATRRLIVVFGAGGDRDPGKRPLMGEIAAAKADLAIVTSDNPRTEDPERILDDIVAGMRGASYERIEDRRDAIKHALAAAEPDDVIVLAGKGHETYQIRGTTSYPFDEKAIVRELTASGRPQRVEHLEHLEHLEPRNRPAMSAEAPPRSRASDVPRRSSGRTFWTLDRVADALEGVAALPVPHGSRELRGVSTDTRTVGPGDLFVALAGERFDAHDFLADAAAKGAAAVVVSRADRAAGLGLPVYIVPDTLVALGRLGRYRRRAWGKRVIAVAGSNGKTSTKDILAAALGSVLAVHASKGNLNNQVGVPLTLLALPDEAEVAVVEMGTNMPGEIALLRAIGEPDVALVTSIGEEHLEGLGDLAGVLREEATVFEGVPLAITPASQPELAEAARGKAARVISAGLDAGDVRAARWSIDSDGVGAIEIDGVTVRPPVRGAHNLRNTMLALAAARECGVSTADAARGIATMPLPSMRVAWEQLGRATLVNDAYNANPASARAALELLAGAGGGRQRVAVLGTMRELGAHADRMHDDVARAALAAPIDVVAGVGDFAAALARVAAGDARVITAPDVDELWAALAPRLEPDAVILLKASRGMRLERMVPHLAAWAAAGGTSGEGRVTSD